MKRNAVYSVCGEIRSHRRRAPSWHASHADAPLTPDAVHRLYDDWIDCAEEAYLERAHGEAFCRAMADAVNACGEWRREAMACLEVWARWLDCPTRSEINSLIERLSSLEKQVREMKRGRQPRARPAAARRRSKAKR